MTQNYTGIVHANLERLFPVRHKFAERFYDQLLLEIPELSKVLGADRKRQETMLFAMISMIVKGMDAGREMDSELMELGRMHAQAQVEEWHFPVFGSVFLDVMIEFLPTANHALLAQAWWNVYTRIYEDMFQGMADERSALLAQQENVQLLGPVWRTAS